MLLSDGLKDLYGNFFRNQMASAGLNPFVKRPDDPKHPRAVVDANEIKNSEKNKQLFGSSLPMNPQPGSQ